MKANLNQLSFTDIYSDVDEYFQQDKPKLIKLFEQHIDLQSLIPQSFYNHYHAETGHPRVYKLSCMISALILKSMLSIADTSLFINILNLSSELRDICGFTTVPDASQFSRFKIRYEKDLKNFFDHLVEITEPICNDINSYLNSFLIVDTTGFEAYVNENNPKKFDTLLRQSKTIGKNNPEFNAHSFACSKMPKESYANSDIKLSYINGHYCYALKTAIVTNGLGIIRDIDFSNNKSGDISEAATASEAKDKYDAKSLIPTLDKFFSKHDFKYKFFLGDAAFDAVDNYKYLYKDKNIIPIIPLRREPSSPLPGFNENGIPTCPNDSKLVMKFDGITREKGRSDRIKWICPKSKKTKINGKTQYILTCENPCTTSKCGKIYQVPIDNNIRMHTVIPRNSEEWNAKYKLRTIIERTNFMIKYTMALKYTKLNNTESLKSEVILSAITQLIVVLIASEMNDTKNILSIKKVIA
ncbi:MAG: transposase [Turicibacter sp.]